MSLALTFRPENFDDILGQYELTEIFKKFTALQKLPHSIFLERQVLEKQLLLEL